MTAEKPSSEKAAAAVKVISSQILDTVCSMESIGRETMLGRTIAQTIVSFPVKKTTSLVNHWSGSHCASRHDEASSYD